MQSFTSRRPKQLPDLRPGPVLALASALALFGTLACAAEPKAANGGTSPSSETSETEGVAPAGKVQALDIVDRAINHHGAEALEGAQVSLRITSKSGSFRMTAEPGAAYDYRVFSQQDGLSVEHHQSNRGLELIEKIVDGRSLPLPGDQERRARDFVAQRVYFPFLPYRLGDAGVWFEDLGLETWDGRELHKVKVSFEPGTSSGAYQEYLYWFDPQSAELVQFAYDFNNGLRLRQLFNTREIGGILFQDARNWAQGGRDRSVDEIAPVDLEADGRWELLSTIALDEIVVAAR